MWLGFIAGALLLIYLIFVPINCSVKQLVCKKSSLYCCNVRVYTWIPLLALCLVFVFMNPFVFREDLIVLCATLSLKSIYMHVKDDQAAAAKARADREAVEAQMAAVETDDIESVPMEGAMPSTPATFNDSGTT